MPKPTILVATWGEGLFAVTSDGRTQEIANQRVRWLAPDGRGYLLTKIEQVRPAPNSTIGLGSTPSGISHENPPF